MFLTVGEKGKTKRTPKKKEGGKVYASGIVYLMKCQLDDGDIVIKIGVTGRQNVQERILENLSAFFSVHRYFPRTTLLKFSRTTDYYKAEAMLHEVYKDKRYKFETSFQGNTEYFIGLDEDELKSKYLEVMDSCKVKPKKKGKKKYKAYDTNDVE